MNTKGVNFQPSERGQFSTAVDNRLLVRVQPGEQASTQVSGDIEVKGPMGVLSACD